MTALFGFVLALYLRIHYPAISYERLTDALIMSTVVVALWALLLMFAAF